MSKVVDFIKDSYEEVVERVYWPKYGELQNKAILVLIASLVFALIIGGIDTVFKYLMDFIYNGQL